MNEKSKRNIILIIIAVFVVATGLVSLAMYNITKSSGKKNSKNTTATMSDAGSITTEAGATEAAKDSTEDSRTTEQATTTEEVKDSKATTEAVASGGSKKDESSSNSKPSSNSTGNSGSGSNGSNSSSGGNNNSGNQKPNNSSSGLSNNSNNSSSSSGSGSTNPSNGNSSNSNSSNSGNNSSSSSGSGNNNSQPSCSHNWVQTFIHHDQVKHTEYYTTTEIAGYHSFCRGCNLDLTEAFGTPECGEARAHLEECNASYEGRPIYQEKQVPYDVIDQEAYDEPAGYKCSICGATK